MAGHSHFKYIGPGNNLPQSIAGIEFKNYEDEVDVSDLIAINELRKSPDVEEVGAFEPEEAPPPEADATGKKRK